MPATVAQLLDVSDTNAIRGGGMSFDAFLLAANWDEFMPYVRGDIQNDEAKEFNDQLSELMIWWNSQDEEAHEAVIRVSFNKRPFAVVHHLPGDRDPDVYVVDRALTDLVFSNGRRGEEFEGVFRLRYKATSFALVHVYESDDDGQLTSDVYITIPELADTMVQRARNFLPPPKPDWTEVSELDNIPVSHDATFSARMTK